MRTFSLNLGAIGKPVNSSSELYSNFCSGTVRLLQYYALYVDYRRANEDSVYIAAPLAVSQITPCRLVCMLDGTRHTYTASWECCFCAGVTGT